MRKISMKMANKKKLFRNVGASVLAMVLVVALVVGLIPSDAMAAESDADTSDRYEQSLGGEASTKNEGRIWTDKSVYTDDVSFEDGSTIGLATSTTDMAANEDFLVAFSALASAEEVKGVTEAPVDVVFVIDKSGSMLDDMSSSDDEVRMKATIDALNDSIQAVMDMNDYTRVSVVAFSNTSEVILPLGRYDAGNYSYQTGGGGGLPGQPQTVTVTDYFTYRNERIYQHAVTEGSEPESAEAESYQVTGGTNIQRGIYEGMNVLAGATTTATIGNNTVNRVPALILLSDGAPTYSSDDAEWWAPENNYSDGPGRNIENDSDFTNNATEKDYYIGNGMKALMTGAYMKDRVNEHYANEISVYTIGMGITGLSNSKNERDLAYATLDPGATRQNASTNNPVWTEINNEWNTYRADNSTPADGVADGTPIVNVGARTNYGDYDDDWYTITHPATNDIAANEDALKEFVDQYYPADTASGVTDVFEQIVNNISISAAETPIEVRPVEDGSTVGYLTYTDPLGEYTEVKDVKALIYNGVKYDVIYNKGTGVATASGDITHSVYGKQPASDILITVTKDESGNETIKIQVPATLIPLRVNTITLNEDGSVDTHTNNGTTPLRVVYSVGVQADVYGEDGTVQIKVAETDNGVTAEYAEKNRADDGGINFYSNLYTGKVIKDVVHWDGSVSDVTVGNTTVEFEPAHNNDFYYMTEDIQILDESGKPIEYDGGDPKDYLIDGDTYHYYWDYYEGESIKQETVYRTSLQLKQTNIIEKDGYIYRAAGSPRLNHIMEFEGTKTAEENKTNTAEEFYLPTFEYADGNTDAYEGKFVVYLGNNGVVSKTAAGHLAITKTVTTEGDLEKPDKSFTFKVNFNGDATLAGKYNYVITDATGATVENGTGTIEDLGQVTLKDGQTVLIKNLPNGTTYTVEEINVPGGFAVKVPNSEGTLENGTTLSGTIVAGETSEAPFTNHYAITTPVTVPTEGGFGGTKVFSDEEIKGGYPYFFTFFLNAYDNAPLPEGYNAETGVTVEVTKDNKDEVNFVFGQITYDQPGEYHYMIIEKEPSASEVRPGVSYSRAAYRVVVDVDDNGDGTLKATTDIRKLYQDDATPLYTYVNGVLTPTTDAIDFDDIVFTNSYDTETVERVPVALKTLLDADGNPMLVESGKFYFVLEAQGYYKEDEPETLVTTDLLKVVPMPVDTMIAGDGNPQSVTTNEEGTVTFMGVEFNATDIPDGDETITFEYKMSEVIPAEAVNNRYEGITYDDYEWIINITLSLDEDNVLNVIAEYPDKNENGQADERIAEFINYYSADSVTLGAEGVAPIEGTKTLTGRDWAKDDQFTFVLSTNDEKTIAAIKDENPTITGVNTGDMSNLASVTIEGTDEDAIKEFVFSNITFTEVGEYKFLITETAGAANLGIEYDSHTTEVTVSVTDEVKDGKLEATVTYNNGSASTDISKAVFENVYTASETVAFSMNATKKLSGQSLEAGEFSFYVDEVAPTNVETVLSHTLKYNTADADNTVDANGYYTGTIELLSDVTYTSTGVHLYKIYEQKPTPVVTGMTYSDAVYWVKVTVKDNLEGELVATVETSTDGVNWSDWTPGGANNMAIEFVNVYTPDSAVQTVTTMHKVISGDRTLAAGEFTFELGIESADYPDGILLPTETKDNVTDFADLDSRVITTTNDANGNIVFGDITFTKPGTYSVYAKEVVPDDVKNHEDVIYDAETDTYSLHGMTYSTQVFRATYTVIDNNAGTLYVRVDSVSGDETFVNVYEATGDLQLEVEKSFTGRAGNVWNEGDEFKFQLAVNENEENKEDGDTAAAVEAGDIVLPTTTSITIDDEDTDKKAAFDAITFKKAGVYEFVVSEILPVDADDNPVTSMNGITYDTEPRVVVVTATNKGDGTISATYEIKDSKTLTFSNTYGAGKTSLNLNVQKVLEGRDWTSEDSFTFKLEGTGDTAKVIGKDVVLTNGDTLAITAADLAEKIYTKSFGIEFSKVGKYTFKLYEVAVAGDANMYFDPHVAEITVTVTDDHNGALIAATPTYTGLTPNEDGYLVFENVFTPDPITVVLSGEKSLSGRTLKDDEFTFEVEGVSAVNDEGKEIAIPMPAIATTTNKADGTVQFSAIPFNQGGTYVYEITEKAGDLAGITYDGGTVTATVVVTHNNDGTLTSKVTYAKVDKDGNAAGAEFLFKNTYTTEKSDPVTIDVTKVVNGEAFTLTANDFRFEVECSKDNPASDPVKAGFVTNTGSDMTFIDDVQFTEPGEYVYTLHEIDGIHGGMVYDQSVYTVTINVTDDETVAQLQADVKITKTDANGTTTVEGNSITFTNTYDPDTASVVLHGHKYLDTMGHDKEFEEGIFNFKISAVGYMDEAGNVVEDTTNVPMPENPNATNTATGLVQFDMITYDVEHVGTYVYEITEVQGNLPGYTYDSTPHRVTVTVTDVAEDGVTKLNALLATVEGMITPEGTPIITFTNTYQPGTTSAVISGEKVLEGRAQDAGEFKFSLLNSDGEEVAETVNGADGTFAFEAQTFTKEGTYYYTVVEKDTKRGGVTYDEATYAVEIVVVDKDGALQVTSQKYFKSDKEVEAVVFNNTYEAAPTSVQLSAIKKLEGREMKAEEFKFVLEDKDGNKIYATNTADGIVLFDAIRFEEAGTYEYKMYEEKGTLEGVTYDETVHTVTITVEDGLDGSLTATVSNDGEAPVFNNTYKAPEVPEEPKDPEKPQKPEEPEKGTPGAVDTGDSTNIIVYLVLALAAAAAIIALVVVKRKGKNR